MATHLSCDACGAGIDRNYTAERFKPELEIDGVRFRAEVIVTSNVRHGGMVSNQGEICLPCLKRVLMEGREVVIQPPVPKIPPFDPAETMRPIRASDIVTDVREHRGERNAARTPRAPGARRK